MDNRHGHYNPGQEDAWAAPQLSPSAPDGNDFQNPAIASHPQPTEESKDYPAPVSFIDRKTGTEYAADGTVINITDPYLHDDRTADDVPMVDMTGDEPRGSTSNDVPRLDMYEGRHPAPPPPYGTQTQVPWIISQPPTNYVYVQQPQPIQTTVITAEVPDHYNFSLFVCLCCCWPIGLCALNKANEARALVREGRIFEAKEASQSAKSYSILGLLIGIVFLFLYIGIAVWRVMLIQESSSTYKTYP